MILLTSTLAGRALEAVIAAVALVRRPRPIHPHGEVREGTIRFLASRARAGIGWIDAGADGTITARISRGAGLPSPLPDVMGIAFRVDTEQGPADLLLASTGLGLPSRFLLSPHRDPRRARYTTIMPYRGERGPVLIGARTAAASSSDGSWVLELLFATPTGLWHRFAEVALPAPPHGGSDTEARFDPVLRPLPGAGTYAWTRRLREPSYRRARRARP